MCCVYIVDELRFVGTLTTKMVSECALGAARQEFMKTTRIQLLWNTTKIVDHFGVLFFHRLSLIIPFLISIRLLRFFFPGALFLSLSLVLHHIAIREFRWESSNQCAEKKKKNQQQRGDDYLWVHWSCATIDHGKMSWLSTLYVLHQPSYGFS